MLLDARNSVMHLGCDWLKFVEQMTGGGKILDKLPNDSKPVFINKIKQKQNKITVFLYPA